jgi:signal transduction histidine kinase
MLEDRKGNLWFGTDGGGVTRFDGKVFTHFTAKEGLNSNSIASILQDDKGNLWFGSFGGGATRFDGEFITVFSKNEGLSNNYINSLLQDHKGNIWMGTRLGPNEIKADQLSGNAENSKPLRIKNFTYDDGFLGVGCNLRALFEDRNGIIWIGSSNRLSALRPEVESPDTVPLNVKLTNIKLFDEKIPWLQIESNKDTSFVLGNGVKVGNFKFSAISKWYFMPEDLSLAYNNNFLSFSFIGISQKQTLKIRYQYQLEGLDKNWSALTGQTEISYGNLKPGNYTFKVKAMNSEGIWSKESQYSFTIRHPWWRSWWFYSFLFLLAGSLFYSYIKWRELEHELHKKLLNKKIEEQTYELKEKNKELGNKNDELQAVNSEKDKFFSIIAHDVRGPLSTFLSFTEIMADNLHSYTMDEIQVMAESMKKSATSLFELLENLLEWARMQRGLIQYNPEQLTLIEVLNEAIEIIHHSAKNKSITLVIEIPSDLEVAADKNMLASIFRNLTSNAVKFTPVGGKVTVRAEKRANNQIEVSVTDTGIGMEQKMIEELFRIDVHNNRRGTNGEVSNGFGLLLSRDFVHKLNGRIWAESEPDKGSTFYFTLQSTQRL